MVVKGNDNKHRDDSFMWKLTTEGSVRFLKFEQD